jgi:endogenous inhibitor of DNA gyrase (YacG/DUF329 family)
MTDPVRLRPKRPCPICSKPSQQKFHPFCSNRCAQIDLSRWLGGHYGIPAVEAEDDRQESSDES